MGRTFSNAKLLVQRVSTVLTTRGYAAVTQSAVSGGGRGGAGRSKVMMRKGGEVSGEKSSWVPDPVTGYYRPENQANQIDAAELRQILLKNKH